MSRRKNLTRRQLLLSGGAITAGAIIAPSLLNLGKAFADMSKAQGRFIPSESWKNGDIVETDLLIIGSGYAGLWAAITAADNGVKNIVLVDKGGIGHSSVASMTSGGSAHLLPEDDINLWTEELVKATGYLSRQDIWTDMLSTSYSRMQKLEGWGIEFKGKNRRFISDGNKYVSLMGGVEYKGIPSGKGVITALLDQAQKRKAIKYYSKTMITSLLKDKNNVVGAIGVHRQESKAVAFKAKAVAIAAGQCSFSGQHAMMELMTGNSYALAYHAGATLNNMEFLVFDVDPVDYGMEGGSILGLFGARTVNAKDEDYMVKYNYDPAGLSAHIRTISRAMAMEVDKGRGPIYLDRTTKEYISGGMQRWRGRWPVGTWQWITEVRIEEIGRDVTKQKDLFYPYAFGIIGAVRANLDCSTDVPGLYVAGVAVSHDPGKMKGCESLRAFWSGEKVGMSAAKYIAKAPAAKLDAKYLDAQLKQALAPLSINGDITPSEIVRKIQTVLFDYKVSILKSDKALQEALASILKIKKEYLPEMYADDPHELVSYYEAGNILLCAELFLRASIERRETRECHYRVDYPELNNKDLLKWINFTKGSNNEPKMSFERVPIEKYPFKPKEVKS